MLCSILMMLIQQIALIYGIVTHVSEPSQNLFGMNGKFLASEMYFMKWYWKTNAVGYRPFYILILIF